MTKSVFCIIPIHIIPQRYYSSTVSLIFLRSLVKLWLRLRKTTYLNKSDIKKNSLSMRQIFFGSVLFANDCHCWHLKLNYFTWKKSPEKIKTKVAGDPFLTHREWKKSKPKTSHRELGSSNYYYYIKPLNLLIILFITFATVIGNKYHHLDNINCIENLKYLVTDDWLHDAYLMNRIKIMSSIILGDFQGKVVELMLIRAHTCINKLTKIISTI